MLILTNVSLGNFLFTLFAFQYIPLASFQIDFNCPVSSPELLSQGYNCKSGPTEAHKFLTENTQFSTQQYVIASKGPHVWLMYEILVHRRASAGRKKIRLRISFFIFVLFFVKMFWIYSSVPSFKPDTTWMSIKRLKND